MPLQTLDTFTFNHKDQVDKLYETKTATQVKEAFDSRGEDLQTKFNSAINVLKSTAVGDSGAENIGSSLITGLAGNTVHEQILQMFNVAKQAQAGTILPGSIEDTQLSDDADQIKQRFASHEADYMYQTAGGTATAITLTGVVLEDGHPKTFIASADNNGADTTINGKHFYKPNTTTSPTLKIGKAYTFWYNLSGDCFFIKASATGTVTSNKVLANETYSTEEDTDLVGAMPNKVGSGTIIEPSNSDQVIPQGYYGGSVNDGKVSAVTLKAGSTLWYTHTSSSFNTAQTAYTKVAAIKIDTAGTIRVLFDLASNIAGYMAYGRIYINGVAVGTERSTSLASLTTFTEDFTINANDEIQLFLKGSNASVSCIASAFKLCTTVKYANALKTL